MSTDQNNADRFSHYLLSTKLEELEKLTNNLYEELQDSKKVMAEICTLMGSIPNEQENRAQQSNGLTHENVSQFFEVSTPRLLLPDMQQTTVDVDLDTMIVKMKEYTEDIMKNINNIESTQEHTKRSIKSLDWEQYAVSLDQFSNRLTNIKMIKSSTGDRNMELEDKMDEICNNVHTFSQVVQGKDGQRDNIQKCTLLEQDKEIIPYKDLINKILFSINGVSCLLSNKN